MPHKKTGMLKQKLNIIWISIFILSCTNRPKNTVDLQTQEDTKISDSTPIEPLAPNYTLGNKMSFKFNYDNSFPDAFGYHVYVDDLVGPSGLVVFGDFIFLIDNYHNSVKRLNYKTKELISSKQFASDNYVMFRITKFNDLLYLSSLTDTIYVLDKELRQVDKFAIEERGRFYGDSRQSLKIWFPENDWIAEINKSNDIILDKEFIGHIGKDDYLNGKECIIDDSRIISGDVLLDISNSSYSKMYFMDFSDNVFAYYDVEIDYENNPEQLEIFIHEIIGK